MLSAATGDDGQTKLAMASSPDAAVPVRALVTVNSKRLLRSYHEEDENDDEEEERGFSSVQIERWTAQAEYWVKDRKTQDQIRQKLTGLSGVMNAKDKKKYSLFLAAWLREHPGGV